MHRYVRRTPLVSSTGLSAAAGADVSLKLESLQVQHSFKSRGAFNAVIALLERGSLAGRQLVTASAGNHGRALALAARTFDLPLVVFTPIDAPRTKLDAIRAHGATLRAEGRDYDEAERMAKTFADTTGAHFISPYNDADVIAGAATIALEMFEDAADIDMLVVPIGGGGLISGVAAVARAIRPDCASSASRWRRRARFRQAFAPAGWSRSFPVRRSPTVSAAILIRIPSPSD